MRDNRLDNQLDYNNEAGTSKLVKTVQYNDNGEIVNVDELLEGIRYLLSRISTQADSLSTVDANNRQRVVVDGLVSSTLGRVFAGADSGAGLAIPNIISANAPSTGIPNAVYYQPVWVGPVDQRWLVKDQARATYANAIRSNLV